MRITPALERAALVSGSRTATIDRDRRRTWTEVEDRVARLAAGLQGIGVRAGDRVAVLAMNCDSFFEAYFAIPWAGAAIVPLNTRLAVAELAFQLRDASVDILLFGREFAAVAEALRAEGAVKTLVGLDAAAVSGHRADKII